MNQEMEVLPVGKEIITLSPASAVTALWGNLTKEYLDDFKNKCLEMKVEDPQDKDGLKVVYEARQIAKNHRLRVDKLETVLKSKANTYRKVVGDTAKEVRAPLKEAETHLKEQEDIVKKEKERLAQEEQIRKQERHEIQIERLVKAGANFDGTTYVWGGGEPISDADVWVMGEFDFEEKLTAIKAWKAVEDERIAQEENEKKLEAQRQALIAEENRVKQEALDKQQAALDAQAKAQKEAQDKIDADLKAQADAKQKAEDDKIQAAEMEEFKKEESERLAREAQVKAQEEAEEKVKTEEAAKVEAQRQAELQPDKEKLLAFAVVLRGITPPTVKSMVAQDVIAASMSHLEKLIPYIIQSAERL